MKRIALITLALCLASCAVQKPQPTIEYRDSIVYRDRLVTDTVKVDIPYEVEKVVTRDTASHLENTYAKSDAVVSGGFLHHSLESIPKVIKVPVTVTVHDTLEVHTQAQTIVETQEVEKPLSWWQRLKIGAFWWLVALCIVGWRRELLALGKKLIKLFV